MLPRSRCLGCLSLARVEWFCCKAVVVLALTKFACRLVRFIRREDQFFYVQTTVYKMMFGLNSPRLRRRQPAGWSSAYGRAVASAEASVVTS